MGNWQNWAGNERCEATIHDVASTEEVVDLVAQITAQGGTLRAANGGSHPGALESGSFSYSPIVTNNNEHIVQTAAMADVTRRPDTNLIDAGPGATTWQLSTQANEQGLSLATTTLIPWISVGGATAVGANGQGWNLGTLSDQLQSIEIVTGSGHVRTYDRDVSPAGWNAASVHLGSLGIVTKATFKAEDRFKLRSVDTILETDDLIGQMPSIVTDAANPYVEMSWFPFNQKAWLKVWNKVPWDTPNKGTVHGLPYDVAQEKFGSAGLDFVAEHPRLTPAFLRLIMDTVTTNGNETIAPSAEVFHWQMDYPKVWDLCYALPITGGDFSAVQAAWRYARTLVCESAKPRDGNCNSIDPLDYPSDATFPQSLMLNCRFLGGSSAYLSTAPDTNEHTCYFEVTTGAANKHYAPFFEALGLKLRQLGGRPHWGKMWGNPLTDPPVWQHWYGDRLEQFNEIRRQCDPNGIFLNDFTRMLFGESS